ncbi:xanthine dehydrogenase small subunit [Polycladidibacter hongkongensis]|uniref:xanthine dehydrogenase small subunit n=1 Tax=Polycladidibacter hongkongensis TaxID=1647556 RepID=UPI000834C71E|nr:xanthine dehydrogenase small subunit [Pseudovibrio hongkongensis]
MREVLKYVRAGRIIELRGRDADDTLLDYIREDLQLKGTKEGCAEGDCGACTVVIGELQEEGVRYRAVNACIMLLGQLDGRELILVEDLAEAGELHPVQQQIVDHHGSQCGFCTPGFVMSCFALYQQRLLAMEMAHQDGGRRFEKLERRHVLDSFAGNLCRCTGYTPLVEAALAACHKPVADKFFARRHKTEVLLRHLNTEPAMALSTPNGFFAAPTDLEDLLALYDRAPGTRLLAGGTDLALEITKQCEELPSLIDVTRVESLKRVEWKSDAVHIGAAVTYSQASETLCEMYPNLGQVLGRIGSVQVRNSGTIGGNIANGSPIGDMPPLLIALGARVELAKKKSERRWLELEDFFIEYGKQALETGEIVARIALPYRQPDQRFSCYKLTKRFDQDISAVLGAFCLRVTGNRITSARIAFGGMAGTPKRARRCEAALRGSSIAGIDNGHPAYYALEQDFQPLSDMRASREYRLAAAKQMLLRALAELPGKGAGLERLHRFDAGEVSHVF